jgi:putative flippase GtrA
MTGGLFRTIVSFLGVGSLGALTYVLLASVLTSAGLSRSVASGLCYAALIPIVYLGHQIFTFRASIIHRVAFPRYVAIQAVGLILSVALPLMVDPAVPAFAVYAVVCVAVAVLSFLLMKFWVFVDRNHGRVT